MDGSRPAHYDVFLSHNSRDKTLVEELARKLEAEGLTVWLDKWTLVAGEPWQEALERGLLQSRVTVVAIGSEGLGPWQQEEMRAAIGARVKEPDRRVIPLLLPGAPEKVSLPPFLGRLTQVDLRSGLDDNEAFQGLVAGIRGRPPRTTEPPEPTEEPAPAAAEGVPTGTMVAKVEGSGAVAQSHGKSVSAGAGGIAIGGDVKGNVSVTRRDQD